jgi:hypothetical protein
MILHLSLPDARSVTITERQNRLWAMHENANEGQRRELEREIAALEKCKPRSLEFDRMRREP